MPAINRSAGRNVHVYNASNPGKVLGGLVLTNGITNTNLYAVLAILFVFGSTSMLENEHSTLIPRDTNPLQPGNYYINTTGGLQHY